MDESVDDAGELAADQKVTRRLKTVDNLSESLADLLDLVHNLLLGRLTGDEVVEVGHDIHADVACEFISGLWDGRDAEHQAGESDKDLRGPQNIESNIIFDDPTKNLTFIFLARNEVKDKKVTTDFYETFYLQSRVVSTQDISRLIIVS